MKRHLIALALFAASGALAHADEAPRAEAATQRNVNQQERIAQGLESGELDTREAARLEREQAAVDRTEARALEDGRITGREQAAISAKQNAASADIYRQKHDAQQGNPDSASSQRMQANVERSANQQRRINEGIESGELTNKEAAELERGQARVNRAQANAGADGRVTAGEQANVQARENRQSNKTHRRKHNAKKRD